MRGSAEAGLRWTVLALNLLASALFAAQPGFDTRPTARLDGQWQGGNPSRCFDSPEFLVDTNISLLPEPVPQEDVAMAFDGANSLVVWWDGRPKYGAIRGARVTPGGSVREPNGITISQLRDTVSFRLAGCPAVSFGEGEFLVVWQAHSQLGGGRSTDIYGARVTPDGEVLDSTAITVSALANDQMYPSVCWDGANFLVVWVDRFSGSWYVRGARVSPQGQVLDPLGLPISADTADGFRPSVAFDGANFLVVWNSAYNIYGARVTPGGARLDTPAIAISRAPQYQQYPVVGRDGGNFLVVWEDQRTGAGDIYGARVTPEGIVLDSAGVAISSATDKQWFPAIAFDGTNFLIVWLDYRDTFVCATFCTRVTPDATVLDTSGVCVWPTGVIRNPQGPSVSYDGGNFSLAWLVDNYRTSYDVYGARVTPEAQVLDSTPLVLATVVGDQGTPATCFGAGGFLVAWADHRSDTTCDIIAGRVSDQGEPLDSGGIVVSATRYSQTAPAVASDGADYLVTWSDWRGGSEYDIYGARVTAAGVVLDSSGIAISTAPRYQEPSALASDGSEYLVVWQDFRVGSWDVYGARVTPAGVVEDSSGIPISTARRYQENPAISFGSADYFVVWQDLRADNFDIYGARVSPDGTVRDTAGIPISTALHGQEHPAVAFDGTNFLVAWQDRRSDTSWRIYCSRVTPQGAVLDSEGIALPVLRGDQKYPAVTFDGTDFIVVWSDSSDASWNISGARVSPDGQVTGAFPIVRQSGDQTRPALAHGADSQSLLAYQGWAGTVNGKSYNTDRIWAKLGNLTGIASEPPTHSRTRLLAVEPNPVRNTCRISFSLSEPTRVSLRLCDATGRFVKTLFEGKVRAGTSDFVLRTSDFPAGVYFLRFETPERQEARKLILTQ